MFSIFQGHDLACSSFCWQLLMTSNTLSACYESNGSLLDTGVATSPQNSLYCPVYESRLVASSRHDLIPTAVYGNSCSKSHSYDTYSTYGPDSTSCYPLVRISFVHFNNNRGECNLESFLNHHRALLWFIYIFLYIIRVNSVRKIVWKQDIQELPKALHITITTTQLDSTTMTDMGKNDHLLFVILVKFGCTNGCIWKFCIQIDYLSCYLDMDL